MELELALRDYQDACTEALRDGVRGGHRRQILCAPTGSGKTHVGMALVKEAAAKGSRTAFICDRLALIYQTSTLFDKYRIDHGIIQAGHWRWRPYERVQVCSSQTLARRGISTDFRLVIVDECFPSGTMIATPSGQKQIEFVRSGDLVYNAFGVGVVRNRITQQTTKRIVKVRLANGKTIRCTQDHLFLTRDAWVQAGGLAGKSVVCIKDMPRLWESLQSHSLQNGTRFNPIRKRALMDWKTYMLQVLLKEIEKPDALWREQSEDVRHAEKDRTQTSRARRERQTFTSRAVANARETWSRLDGRIYPADRTQTSAWISAPLQNRLSKQETEGRHRTGRPKPLRSRATSTRREKRRASFFTRVESVEIEKRRGDAVVHNLRVEGHPSYFADGVLVHNCHTAYATTTKFILSHPDIITIGLTATPFTKGLGEVYSRVVNVTTTDKLLDEGWLAPIKAYASKAIDMKGAKLKFDGEWTESEMQSRGIKIIGDVIEEWINKTRKHFDGPVKTIVFSATVDHGTELCRQFQSAGFNFQQISYKDGNDESRKTLIEEFRKPDSEITGLVSCEVLAKGFDVPDIQCGIMCRPYRKSLSGHVQQIGRLMRPWPGKDFALLLDHAGNFLRFRDDTAEFFANGVSQLDDGAHDAKPRKDPEEAEKKQMVCGQCAYIMTVKMTHCPACGWERPRRLVPEHIAGTMHEIGLKKSKAIKVEEWLLDKERVWRQICHHALERKGGDAVAAERFGKAQYRSLYGQWPRYAMRNIVPETPDPRLVQRIRHNLIRFFKRRESGGRALTAEEQQA